MRWDPKTRLSLGLLKLDYNTSQRHIRHVGGRSYELGLIGKTDAYKPGMMLTAGPRAGHTILLSNSTACTVQGLTIHGTSDSTFSICRAMGEFLNLRWVKVRKTGQNGDVQRCGLADLTCCSGVG